MTGIEVPGRSCHAAGLIDEIRLVPDRRSELVDLLDERADVYDGLSALEAERLRGYILASFARTGLPDEGLPYVVEELATGTEPYTLAAAGRALRGAFSLPPNVSDLLKGAMQRIEANDDYVQFDRWNGDHIGEGEVSARADMLRTIAMIGPRLSSLPTSPTTVADRRGSLPPEVRAAPSDAGHSLVGADLGHHSCCTATAKSVEAGPQVRTEVVHDVSSVALQDQSGASFTFAEFFIGRPSVVTFFYTRCMNPEKCSLTIGKLARLQRRVGSAGMHDAVNVAAVTYDPDFDGPDRLHLYGRERGFAFDRRNRLLRTRGPLAPLLGYFDLGVGFGPSTPNRHRVELFVLDRDGRISASFVRVQWCEQDVLQTVCGVVEGGRGEGSKCAHAGGSSVRNGGLSAAERNVCLPSSSGEEQRCTSTPLSTP